MCYFKIDSPYTPIVFKHGANGDAVALRILTEQVQWATRYLDCLLAKGASKIALTGGVSQALKTYFPASYLSHLCEAEGDAMDGAIFMAQQKIGRSYV